MINRHIDGAHRGVGAGQGFLGISVLYGTASLALTDGREFESRTATTAWEPTPDELARLNAGASVMIELCVTPPIPPMLVFVGEAPK